jgi:hypothetical protein
MSHEAVSHLAINSTPLYVNRIMLRTTRRPRDYRSEPLLDSLEMTLGLATQVATGCPIASAVFEGLHWIVQTSRVPKSLLYER